VANRYIDIKNYKINLEIKTYHKSLIA